MASAAPTLKRLSLELGGNDAAIVLADNDPATVAPKLYSAAFRNNGKLCMAVKRLYVHDRIYDEVHGDLGLLKRPALDVPCVDSGLPGEPGHAVVLLA